MKIIIIITLFFTLAFPFTVSGQNKGKHPRKNHIYNVSIKTNQESVRGFLHEVYEDSLTIILSQKTKNVYMIEGKEIEKIKIRRKGRVGRSTWQGALIGAGAGFLLGYAAGDDEPGWFSYTKEEKAAQSAFAVGAVGALTGALIGTGSKKIVINYDLKAYRQSLTELRKYTLVNR